METRGVEFSDAVLEAAVERMAGNIRLDGSFYCASCANVKKAEFLYSIGVYIPKDHVMTEAGEKMRVIIYPVCGLCGKKAPEKLVSASEKNIETSGMLLDPAYHPPPE